MNDHRPTDDLPAAGPSPDQPTRKFVLLTVTLMAEVTDSAELRIGALEDWDARAKERGHRRWAKSEEGQAERALNAEDDVSAIFQLIAAPDISDLFPWGMPGLEHVSYSLNLVAELQGTTLEQAEAARRWHEQEAGWNDAGTRRPCRQCARTGCTDHSDLGPADEGEER